MKSPSKRDAAVRRLKERLEQAFPGVTNLQHLSERGGNGEPFSFEQEGLRYFVKVLDPDRIPNEGLRGVEPQALRRVNSSRVVKLVREGELPGSKDPRTYLLFPFVVGDSLEKLIGGQTENKMTNEELFRFARQIAQAIADMWAAHVVHRDLKPRNIIKREDGDHVVLDLGIALFAEPPNRDMGKSRGSRLYSSPEQFSATRHDELAISFSSDHFALGTMLYELATGVHPFRDISGFSGAAEAVCRHDPPDPSSLRSELDLQLSRIILRLLKKHPCDRYMAPEELIADLNQTQFLAPGLSPTRFFVQQGPSAAGGSRHLVESVEVEESRRPDGFLLSLSNLPNAASVRKLGEHSELAIDPETFRLSFSNAPKKILKLLNIGRIDNPSIFSRRPDDLRLLAERTVSKQIESGADYIIAPYFVIGTLNDRWIDINDQLWFLVRQFVDREKITKPVLGALALSNEVVRSPEERKSVLDRVLGSYYVDGFYLAFQNESRGSGPITNLQELEGLREIVSKLSARSLVMVGRADLVFFPLLHNGIVATSPEESIRRFSFDKLDQEAKQIGSKKIEERIIRYYSDPLMDFVEGKDTLNALEKLGFADAIACSCPFCERSRPRDPAGPRSPQAFHDARMHFLVKLSQETRATRRLSLEERRQYYRQRLSKADELGKRIRKTAGTGKKGLAQYEGLIPLI